jgi:hypothetical protein
MIHLDFLRFTPVPLRARRDGWPPVLQRRFILNLARGMGASEAARSVGRSRQSVYALRDRPGAEAFARAWDRAIEFARAARAAPRAPRSGLPGGLDEIWVPRTYRGRLVGYVVREDVSGAFQRLATLDRVVERLGPVDPDAPDFEDIIDLIASGRGSEIDNMDKTRRATRSTSSISGEPFDSSNPNL